MVKTRGLKIFVWALLDEPSRSLLRQALESDDVYWANKEELSQKAFEAFQEAEIVFGNVPADWLERTHGVRWIQLESIGFEYYYHLQLVGVSMTNLKGLFFQPAAETALAGILSFYRGLNILALKQFQKQWVSLLVRPRSGLLHGSNVIILGHGSIGRKVRSLLEAFDCRIQNFARKSKGAHLHTLEALDAELGKADIVVNCLPHTPETRGLIDQIRLSKFKDGALFVNIGRGSVIDEAALVDALQEGSLGGAVIDVTQREPIPEDHPLWDCPNTILTQHTAGGHSAELTEKALFFLENLQRYREGAALKNIVDFARGY